jgi:serine phosphatase RsbU (regulator of sigma subunit)/anti-sigma regulatory factor (Ser/Thr protein kinase)
VEDGLVEPAQPRRAANAVKYSEYAQCEIAPELESVRVVIEKLRAYCSAHGLAPTIWPAVELAVAEGINNAIEHGCAAHPEGRVRVRWSWEGDVLETVITDPSDFLPDPAAAARELPEDPFSESGRGAFLMHTLMDGVEHRIEDGRHTLVLRKTAGPKQGSAAGTDPQSAVVLEAMIEDLGASYENLNALFRFAEHLATSTSFEEFLEAAMPRLVELVAGTWAFLRIASPTGSLKPVYPPKGDPDQAPATPLDTQAAATESEVFRTGQPRMVEYCARLASEDPLAREDGSAYVCPVDFQGTTLGVLAVQRAGQLPRFNAAQANVIRVVGEFIGIAHATATLQMQRREQQRTIRELEIAAEIQQLLLPRSFPDLPKTRIFGVSTASLQVGGDYFDVIPVEDLGVLVVIADVMGKGMPAALLATIFRAAIRARLHLAALPGFLLTETNRQIKSDLAQLDMFITAQLAFFSYRDDEVSTATAGHCPIVKYSMRTRQISLITDGGAPLGVLDDVVYHSTTTLAEPASQFLLLTDGIYEVLSPRGQMLGLEGVQTQMRELAGGSPAEFCRQLLDYVQHYTGEAQQTDDRTVVVVERS